MNRLIHQHCICISTQGLSLSYKLSSLVLMQLFCYTGISVKLNLTPSRVVPSPDEKGCPRCNCCPNPVQQQHQTCRRTQKLSFHDYVMTFCHECKKYYCCMCGNSFRRRISRFRQGRLYSGECYDKVRQVQLLLSIP